MMTDYGTATGFRTYHTARGRDVTAYTDDAVVEAAILVASEWLDARYRSQYPGLKVGGRDQIREWPRAGAVDVNGWAIPADGIPTEIENATYEVTLIQLVDPTKLSKDYTPPKYERVRVDGALDVTYNRSIHGSSDIQIQFQAVNEALSSLLMGSQTSSLSGGVTR